MAVWQQLQQQVHERIGEASLWTRRMATEVQLLPDTMYRLRDGARNFQIAGEHLAASAKSLEQVSQLYENTAGATIRQSSSLLGRLQDQAARLPDPSAAPDVAVQINDQVREIIEALTALNPMWPSSSSGSARDSL